MVLQYLILSSFSLFQGKKKRNIKSWDQQNYLVIREFCYISDLFIMRFHCTCMMYSYVTTCNIIFEMVIVILIEFHSWIACLHVGLRLPTTHSIQTIQTRKIWEKHFVNMYICWKILKSTATYMWFIKNMLLSVRFNELHSFNHQPLRWSCLCHLF